MISYHTRHWPTLFILSLFFYLPTVAQGVQLLERHIPVSDLPWKVTGLFFHERSEHSAAILQLENQEQLYVRAKSVIAKNIRIYAIDDQGIVLDNHGHHERLYLTRMRHAASEMPIQQVKAHLQPAPENDPGETPPTPDWSMMTRQEKTTHAEAVSKRFFESRQLDEVGP